MESGVDNEERTGRIHDQIRVQMSSWLSFLILLLENSFVRLFDHPSVLSCYPLLRPFHDQKLIQKLSAVTKDNISFHPFLIIKSHAFGQLTISFLLFLTADQKH